MSDPVRTADPERAVAQLQAVLEQVERALLLMDPGRPKHRAHYNKLRKLRDRLEEAFVVAQIESLRAGAKDVSADVERLKAVVTDLEAATKRAAKAREVLGYISVAVEVATQVVSQVLVFV